MSTVIATAQFLLSLIPHIIAIAQAVEVPGNGADKAATVTQLVMATINTLPSAMVSKLHIDSVESFANKVLTIVVTFFNKVGVFKTSAAAASTAS